MSLSEFSRVPVIDVAPLVNQTVLNHTARRAEAAEQIGTACRECGFFYIAGHGVDESLGRQLEALSRQFFDQSEPEKMQIAMSRGGRAWRDIFR
jgi:isopenicillin N synthase-like dioxygenase